MTNETGKTITVIIGVILLGLLFSGGNTSTTATPATGLCPSMRCINNNEEGWRDMNPQEITQSDQKSELQKQEQAKKSEENAKFWENLKVQQDARAKEYNTQVAAQQAEATAKYNADEQVRLATMREQEEVKKSQENQRKSAFAPLKREETQSNDQSSCWFLCPVENATESVNGINSEKVSLMKRAGISPLNYGHVDYIITRESSWNPDAVNASSGAEGLPQALPYSKTNCGRGDAVCQLKWANRYAVERYGSWSGAETFWRNNGWW